MEANFYKSFIHLLLVVALFAPLFSFGQTLCIEAKIYGSSSKKAYLSVRGAGNQDVLLDSTVSVNDKFAFFHKPVEVNLFRITIDQVPGSIAFVLDGNLKIEGESKAIWESRVSGSPLTEELRNYDLEFTDPAREKVINLSKMMREPNMTPDKRVELDRQQREIAEAMDRQTEKYIGEHPKSFISLLFLDYIWQSLGPDKTKKILGTLDQELRTHSIVTAILEEIKLREAVKVGKAAPNFKARDLDGNEVLLSNLRGQYVILDFWGSWCGPCIKLIPETKEAFKRYQGKKVQFLGVAFDEEKDKDRLKELIKKHGLMWPQIFQDMSDKSKSDVVNKYLVNTYPSVILINPQGNIIYRGVGKDGLVEACRVLDTELTK